MTDRVLYANALKPWEGCGPETCQCGKDVEGTMSIRFLRSSSLSCGASGRGGVLGIELISDTIGKLNTIYVATSDDDLIPLYVLTQAYWTVVLDLGNRGLWGDCCCRVAARVLPGAPRASLCTYPLVDWLVYRVFKRRMMNTQHWSRVGKFRVTGALVNGGCSCQDRCGEGYQGNSSLTQ